MPYIVSCGVSKYLGTDNANRLAVVRSLGAALQFDTPADGWKFLAKKANKKLKARSWFSMQVSTDDVQMFSYQEEEEDEGVMSEDVLEENVPTLVMQEKAELAPEYVRDLLTVDFDVQAVINSLNVIKDEFSKLDERHEKLNKALSLYDKAISDIMHAIEGSDGEGKNALIDDVIRVQQLRKLRKCRRIIKIQVLLYNELSPHISAPMRKGALQKNLAYYADGTQKVYNTRIMNYGVLMNSDSYVPRDSVCEAICSCMSGELVGGDEVAD